MYDFLIRKYPTKKILIHSIDIIPSIQHFLRFLGCTRLPSYIERRDTCLWGREGDVSDNNSIVDEDMDVCFL